MAAVTPEQLEPARRVRARELKIRRRRSLIAALAGLAVVGAVALVLARAQHVGQVDPGAVASPVAASALDLGVRPQDRVIARAGLVELHLPVDRARVAQTLFRPIDDANAVALDPASGWKHVTAPRDGRAGPETAGMDIAAPPGTIVYSPVNGTIVSVSDYVVAGKHAGYEVDISPDTQSDVVVRVRHITGIPVERLAGPVCGAAGFDAPNVGAFVTAGVTCIGQVRDASDLSDVARPEIAKYVAGPGNHVHMEVVRVGS